MIGALLLWAYFGTRQSVLLVAAGTLNLAIVFQGKNRHAIVEVITKIEEAKDYVEKLGGYPIAA